VLARQAESGLPSNLPTRSGGCVTRDLYGALILPLGDDPVLTLHPDSRGQTSDKDWKP
jgi:hypothetical protein